MKSYTDIEQSKKIAEFLPLESADMWYQYIGNSFKDGITKPIYFPMVMRDDPTEKDVPAWSLAALLSVLPFQFIVNNQRYGFGMNKGLNWDGETYAIKYATFYTTHYFHLTDYYNNPIDACVAMIEKLHELNLL